MYSVPGPAIGAVQPLPLGFRKIRSVGQHPCGHVFFISTLLADIVLTIC